jgi:hypothetical protein
MSFCAPSRGNDRWTCFSLEELDVMVDAWNKTRLGKKYPIRKYIPEHIPEHIHKKNTEAYQRYLWSSLQQRFAPFCGENETCWLDSVELSKRLQEISPQVYKMLNFFTLKPKGTRGKHDWLSTTEIDYVMQQYEQVYPDFKYIGCFPSDYYKLAPGKFPSKILDTKRRAAIVFNLDESHQKGSHWVAVFFDQTPTGRRVVEYFDPTGDKPIKNLKQFLDNPYFFDSIRLINSKKHQRGNNECGVYSLFYILERLKGKTFGEINGKGAARIPDADMNRFRSNLFRPFSEKFHF